MLSACVVVNTECVIHHLHTIQRIDHGKLKMVSTLLTERLDYFHGDVINAMHQLQYLLTIRFMRLNLFRIKR